MQVSLLLCVAVFAWNTVAVPVSDSRGCIYVNGHCHRECEVGTHAYTTGCGFLTPEPTCDNPKPEEDRRGRICDFSACYCDAPTLRSSSGACIPISECASEPKNQTAANLVPPERLLIPEIEVIEKPDDAPEITPPTEEAAAPRNDSAKLLHPRGCIYIDGICDTECEVGTHSYDTGCGFLTPEPTCVNPNPQEDRSGRICDFSACYCDAPTVRSISGACIPISECANETKNQTATSVLPKRLLREAEGIEKLHEVPETKPSEVVNIQEPAPQKNGSATVLHPRGCIYINGICDTECEVGTHAYTTGCGFLTAEPSCDNPNPQENKNGRICDFSACYCDSPTVRSSSGACIPINECASESKSQTIPQNDF